MESTPLVTNDAVVLGMLMVILGLVFWTSSIGKGFWKKFYTYVPSLLLCYFLPSLLSTAGIISGDSSNLYFVASRYLLPTSLVLLTLSVDLKGILRLGPKAVIMFVTGTTGIVIGGPLAILLVSTFNPEVVGADSPNARRLDEIGWQRKMLDEKPGWGSCQWGKDLPLCCAPPVVFLKDFGSNLPAHVPDSLCAQCFVDVVIL